MNASRLAEDLQKIGIAGKTVGVHSKLSAIGPVDPSPLSAEEEKRGMKPFAKTVVNAFLEALGPEGTLFVPTHANCTLDSYTLKYGYYHPDKSPSNVGVFTQSVVCDDRSVRSLHPTHSIAAIGPESQYLIDGHDLFAQPVGIQNAFAKTVGLDGLILFIGDVIKANTTFHAYETLLLPALAPYFSVVAAAEHDGLKRTIAMDWSPNFHRDFYDGSRETRAISAMHKAGLIKEAKLGEGPLYWFEAKAAAKFFAEEIFPNEPDILFCKSPELCGESRDCENIIGIMKRHYAGPDGSWDSDKIRTGMNPDFLRLIQPGIQRL